MLEKLYAQFGQLVLQMEMIQNQVNQVKQQIGLEMQKQIQAAAPQDPPQE